MVNDRIKPMYEVLSTNEDGKTTGVVGYSYNEEVATALAEGKGAFDSNGTVNPIKVIAVDDKIMILREEEPIQESAIFDEQFIIDRAKAKLSPSEMKYLGIEEQQPDIKLSNVIEPHESNSTEPY